MLKIKQTTCPLNELCRIMKNGCFSNLRSATATLIARGTSYSYMDSCEICIKKEMKNAEI